MKSRQPDDDLIVFAPEEEMPQTPDSCSAAAWKILVVDDDEDVHRATRFALGDVHILGRPLEILSARSAAQARELLRNETGVVCVLLDVVMENEYAGLDLVKFIRDDLGDEHVQIVLRTGQPGYAPEVGVIRNFDINDYRSKSELTHARLVTTLTASIRAYIQLNAIESGRRGMQCLVEGAAELSGIRDVGNFCRGVLDLLEQLLDTIRGAVLCREVDEGSRRWDVLAASGELSCHENTCIDVFTTPELASVLSRGRSDGGLEYFDPYTILPLSSPSGEHLVLCVQSDRKPGEVKRGLLSLLATNVRVGYDNARMFEHIERLAYYDELTGLPNRASVEELVASRMEARQAFTLVLIDIDNFQTVNDGLGRDAGDRILRAFTRLLHEYFGAKTSIGRIAGDNFVVLLPGGSGSEAESRFNALARRLADGIRLEDYAIPLTMTGGLVVCPEHGEDVDELLHNAGIALKHGKRRARSTLCRFDREFEHELKRRLDVARDLRAGINNGELLVYYQPRVSLSSNRVNGVEALVRWQRPEGIMLPGTFLDAAEESGLIVEIGQYVLNEACRQQLIWRERHGIDLTVAVNVSMRQLRDVSFLEVVDETLRHTGVDPARIEFEMTESVMMEDTDMVRHLLAELRRRGFCIAIDDFGTGYSSLAYLQTLPLDRLKIDQSFVTGVDEREEDRVIISMIVQMSHLLNLQVVAEGVETARQLARLQALNCDECQGFFHARPMPDSDIPEFVRTYHGRS